MAATSACGVIKLDIFLRSASLMFARLYASMSFSTSVISDTDLLATAGEGLLTGSLVRVGGAFVEVDGAVEARGVPGLVICATLESGPTFGLSTAPRWMYPISSDIS